MGASARIQRGRRRFENEASVADEPFQIETEVGGERGKTGPGPEGATPPGYDWPTHGGYLGCLIGVMLSCLLAPLGYIVVGFLGAFLSHPLGGLGVGIAIAATVIGYIVIFVGLMRLGWTMGQRFLREYPQPAPAGWVDEDELSAVDAVESHRSDADMSVQEDVG